MLEGPCADSEEKRVLASDLDTVMVDSLKALDLIRPIREADISPLQIVKASPAASQARRKQELVEHPGANNPKTPRRCLAKAFR